MSRNAILLGLAMLCGVLGVNVAAAGDPDDYSPLTRKANRAGAADMASTAAGLAAGAVEANPLGPLTVPLKAWALQRAREKDIADRVTDEAGIAAWWGGAAANNVCVIAAIASGGVFALACPFVGIAWGVTHWNRTADVRRLAQHCQGVRTARNDPTYDCRAIFEGTEVIEDAEWAAGMLCHMTRQRLKQPDADCKAWMEDWRQRYAAGKWLMTHDEAATTQ